MSKILSKIGKKKRIAGKKNRWEKRSKIGSALVAVLIKVEIKVQDIAT